MVHPTLAKKDELRSRGWASSEIRDLEEKLFPHVGFHHKSLDVLFFAFIVVAFALSFLFGLIVSSLWFVFNSAVFYLIFSFFALFAGLLFMLFVHVHSNFERHHHLFLLVSSLLLSFSSIFLVRLMYLWFDSRFALGIAFYDVWLLGAVFAILFSLPYAIHWTVSGIVTKRV